MSRAASIVFPTRRAARGGQREIVVAGLLGLGLLGGAFAAISSEDPPEKRTVTIIAVDASTSSARDTLCADLERIGHVVFDTDGAVELTVLASGDQSTNYEPVRIGSIARSPSMRALEGKARADNARKRALQDLAQLCDKIPEHSVSPIIGTLTTAAGYFTEAPCNQAHVSCQLWLRTDGIEVIDRTVRRALSGKRVRERQPRVQSDNVSIRVCGLSERRRVKGQRRTPSLRAVQAAFTPEFTTPENVTFSSACAAFSREVRR